MVNSVSDVRMQLLRCSAAPRPPAGGRTPVRSARVRRGGGNKLFYGGGGVWGVEEGQGQVLVRRG